MKKCSRCKEVKEFTAFCKQSRSKDGYQPACKVCMNDSYNRSRKKKHDHYIQTAKDRRRTITDQIRNWKSERGCLCCAEKFGPCLELHHLDSSIKEDNPSNYITKSFDAFLQEAKKCVVLCANCHRKVHHGIISL